GYTSEHVQADGTLSTGMVFGESCIIEYHEPAAVRGEGSLELEKLAHAYRMVSQVKSGSCNVDVFCSEGSNWVPERNAVVRIRVIISSGAGYCTGTLMNNTAQNCRGYILTAFHCTEQSVDANFSSYVFRFNYQRDACNTGSATGTDITGCVRRAGSQDQGGQFGSDYSLLEMIAPVPASFNPYWAGWDNSDIAPTSGVCMHHPAGDVKKVSTYTAPATSTTWAGFTNGSHWQVYWAATANGHGVTEPGSSGSPLFDQNKRVVGTLTGGASCCTDNGCNPPPTGPGYPDKFGKMSYHWFDLNPNPTAEWLYYWLAPVGNPTTLDGTSDPCGNIGVEEIGAVVPEVFPNPASGLLSVRLPQALTNAERIEVQDLTGRLVHAQRVAASNTTIDVSGWERGCYLLNVIGDGARSGSVKVVVE
ncbi:MAG TPA: T9SS type A sorting domain-containing protein, partial [Flavobacteriales bacterium]|nr:T9SS type A sorting domain-containing protein [Flavobacteriales bacterium]